LNQEKVVKNLINMAFPDVSDQRNFNQTARHKTGKGNEDGDKGWSTAMKTAVGLAH
jgi:hypothetical protein